MTFDPVQRYRCRAVGDVPLVLPDVGLVVFQGGTDKATLLRFARSIMTVLPHRDSDGDGVTTITDQGPAYLRGRFARFTACALNPHTNGSGVAQPPSLVMSVCRQPAATGGECVLVDGQAIYDDLCGSEPDALRAFRTPRSVLFGGAGGYLGAIFTDLGEDRVAMRLRLDELAQFSPDVSRWLPTLHAVIDRHAVTVALDVGEGYILNNHRWLHGRHAFTGQRVLYRIIGSPLPHLAIVTGFRPLRRISRGTAA